jgi:septum formation protein
MSLELFSQYRIILASASPRRKQLLKEMGIQFETCPTQANESYPMGMKPSEVAIFLSKRKAEHIDKPEFTKEDIIITADTVVSLDGQILSKPEDHDQAISFLKILSGKMHYVYTGVTLKNSEKSHSFLSESKVWFRELSDDEIAHYVTHFQPFDKAGAYGIQEWIGYIGIVRIDGSFFNVMGLPTSMLYSELLKFITS